MIRGHVHTMWSDDDCGLMVVAGGVNLIAIDNGGDGRAVHLMAVATAVHARQRITNRRAAAINVK